MEKDTEPLNQGNVVHIETTAGKQVIDQLLRTPPLPPMPFPLIVTKSTQKIEQNNQEHTHTNDASATHLSQATNEKAIAAETTDFDPL